MNDKKRQLSSTSTLSDLDLSLNLNLDKSVLESKPAENKGKKKGKANKKPKLETIDSDMSEALQKKIEEINDKLSKMLTKNDKNFIKSILVDTLEEMKDRIIGQVLQRVEIIESELFDKAIEQTNLKKEVQECKLKNTELKDENKLLKQEILKETNLRKEHINNLEQYGRRNNIRVTGIDFDNKHETAYDTSEGIIKIINDKMGLELSVYDIDIAHRIGKYKHNQIRPVIIKFISRHTKNTVMRNTKHLKGTALSFNEDLTQLNQKVLSSMRLKDKSRVSKAWSFEGQLYVKYKDDKTEVVTYSAYQQWLDLPWPKDKLKTA